MVSYGIAGGALANVVAMVSKPEAEGTEYDGPSVSHCSGQEVRDQYEGWEPEVIDLLKVS